MSATLKVAIAGPELKVEHIHHIAQPQAVNEVADAAGENQAGRARETAQRVPHNPPHQHPQHRQNNPAGDPQQQPFLAGKAGPRGASNCGRASVPETRGTAVPSPTVPDAPERPRLDPLVKPQQRRTQQSENHIIHSCSFSWAAPRCLPCAFWKLPPVYRIPLQKATGGRRRAFLRGIAESGILWYIP